MESLLSVTWGSLSAEVGSYLGYGFGQTPPYNDLTPYTPFQLNRIQTCLDSGYRRFLHPQALPGESSAYEWSFLKSTSTLALANNATVVPLPDDFGQLEGVITLPGPGMSWPVQITGEGKIRELFSVTPAAVGRPIFAAVQPLVGTTGTAGQRFQLYIFPLSDAAYTLQIQYAVLAAPLSATNPFPLGGMAHAETILESCLAVAEARLDDERQGEGPHYQEFINRLTASVAADRRLKPQQLGYNRDQSDLRPFLTRADQHGWSLVSYKGVFY